MFAKITLPYVEVNELNLYLLQVKEAVYNTCPNAQYRTYKSVLNSFASAVMVEPSPCFKYDLFLRNRSMYILYNV